jgi:hypothetical protein
MTFTVVYDANVLYPNTLRDLLIRIAQSGTVQAKWMKDFPASDLGQWEIEAKSPDAFVLDQVGINVRAVAASVRQIADSRTNPPESVEDILSQLERDGLVESVATLRAT